jgi:hypothetical protein
MRQSFIEAFRSLRRERASSLLALVCLSIAIGTNTTVFSIVNGLNLDADLRGSCLGVHLCGEAVASRAAGVLPRSESILPFSVLTTNRSKRASTSSPSVA